LNEFKNISISFFLAGSLWGNLAGVGNETATKPQEQVMATQAIFIQNNSIQATKEINERDDIMGLIASLSVEYGIDYECYKAIIRYESNFNPTVCNFDYGCRGGQGLAQLIPSTVKDCEKELGRAIDPFNPRDNLECGAYLMARDGTSHWGTESTWWGSYHNWAKYCYRSI
jgi:soluble lytic murein transglycosylase-like protein